MNPWWLQILLFSLYWPGSLYAGAGESSKEMSPICPAQIEVDSNQNFRKMPSGWRQFIDVKNDPYRVRLVAIKFYDGEPEGMAQLAPVEDGIFSMIPGKQQYWVVCEYDKAFIQLARPLPQTLKECRINYEDVKKVSINGRPVPLGISCK